MNHAAHAPGRPRSGPGDPAADPCRLRRCPAVPPPAASWITAANAVRNAQVFLVARVREHVTPGVPARDRVQPPRPHLLPLPRQRRLPPPTHHRPRDPEHLPGTHPRPPRPPRHTRHPAAPGPPRHPRRPPPGGFVLLPAPGRQRPREHLLLDAAQLRQRLSPRRVEDRLRVRPSRPALVPGAMVAPSPRPARATASSP
jgi:hypothetical protein